MQKKTGFLLVFCCLAALVLSGQALDSITQQNKGIIVSQDFIDSLKKAAAKVNPITAKQVKVVTDQEKQPSNALIALIVMAALIFLYAMIHTIRHFIRKANPMKTKAIDPKTVEQQSVDSTKEERKEQEGATAFTAETEDQETVEEVAVTFPSSGDRYFFGEVMVTAGPRKNFTDNPKDGDYGLGEDVAGFICMKEVVYFWVLDGTSNADRINIPHPHKAEQQQELFSSRLLAQTIGWNIQESIKAQGKAIPMAVDILNQAIQLTQHEWQEKLDKLPSQSKADLEKMLRDRKSIHCSTTALLGTLSLNGDLDICLVGDSKVITLPPLKKNMAPKGRLFTAISLDENDKIELVFNPLKDIHQTCQQLKIHTLIAMTDGISYPAENWLQGLTSIDFSSKNIRSILAHQAANTQDDKAICIIQIKSSD